MANDLAGKAAEHEDIEAKTGKPFLDPVKCQEVE